MFTMSCWIIGQHGYCLQNKKSLFYVGEKMFCCSSTEYCFFQSSNQNTVSPKNFSLKSLIFWLCRFQPKPWPKIWPKRVGWSAFLRLARNGNILSKTFQRTHWCFRYVNFWSLRIQVCPKISGFPLQSYSRAFRDGIKTTNPIPGKGLDSEWMNNWNIVIFWIRWVEIQFDSALNFEVQFLFGIQDVNIPSKN